jgi:RNA polymerase sigma-70 factor (ECF subfamily)
VARRPGHNRREEFEQVALPHLKALYNFALKLTLDPKDAEDLVQETFLRAFRFFDTYTPGTQIRAWLFRILRNVHINRYRAARARPEETDLSKIEGGWEQNVSEEFLREHGPRSPERAFFEGVLDEEVERALAALPEEYREVVLLALVEELSYKEIAQVLSIPIGTVMSRLHRGRRILQARLLDYARRRGIVRSGAAVSNSGDRSR